MGGFIDDDKTAPAPSEGGFVDETPPSTGFPVIDIPWPAFIPRVKVKPNTLPFSRKPAERIYGNCVACGGSDHPVIGLFSNPPFSGTLTTGHKLGCPRGKVGTPIGEEH